MDKTPSHQGLVSVVIPAYNEAKTLGGVLRPILGHKLIGEIIVVDDGSRDGTANVARALGVTVVTMARNGGKARAMQAGVLKAAYDVILFLDADLTGLDCSMVDTIVMPVLRGERDMFIGICGRRTILTNRLTLLLPKWGGQRALTKVVWSEVPMRYKKHFEIELALNYFALRNHRRTGFTILYKLGQITKEVKRGLLHGAYQRIFMYRDLIWVVIRMYLFESALFILWKVMSASRLTRFINKAFK